MDSSDKITVQPELQLQRTDEDGHVQKLSLDSDSSG